MPRPLAVNPTTSTPILVATTVAPTAKLLSSQTVSQNTTSVVLLPSLTVNFSSINVFLSTAPAINTSAEPPTSLPVTKSSDVAQSSFASLISVVKSSPIQTSTPVLSTAPSALSTTASTNLIYNSFPLYRCGQLKFTAFTL